MNVCRDWDWIYIIKQGKLYAILISMRIQLIKTEIKYLNIAISVCKNRIFFHLWRRAYFLRPEFTRSVVFARVSNHGEAALIVAVFLPATVTLLSCLHYSVAADGSLVRITWHILALDNWREVDGIVYWIFYHNVFGRQVSCRRT